MSKIPNTKSSKVRPYDAIAALYEGLYARGIALNIVRDENENNNEKDKKNIKTWNVKFVDYGNRAPIPESQMVKLPPELNLKAIPPLAYRCELGALRPPMKNQANYWRMAGEYFATLTMSKKMKIKILYDDYYNHLWYVELFHGNESINKSMVSQGYLRFIKNLRDFEALNDEYINNYLKDIKTLKDQAVHAHKNMWYFGEIDSEDEQQQY